MPNPPLGRCQTGQARTLPSNPVADLARREQQARHLSPAKASAGPDAHPEDTMDDGYDLLAVRIKRGTTINGAIVALCPDADGVVTADVCIDGPPIP